VDYAAHRPVRCRRVHLDEVREIVTCNINTSTDVARYASRGRVIKLKGEEKPLKARSSNTTSTKDAPSDFS
jgi:hypothetical protein